MRIIANKSTLLLLFCFLYLRTVPTSGARRPPVNGNFTTVLRLACPHQAAIGTAASSPNATALLHALLDDADLNGLGAYWQGSAYSLYAGSELLRYARNTLLTPRPEPHLFSKLCSGSLQPARQQQESEPTAVSSWLSSVERFLTGLPSGPSYPALRRGIVALLLHARVAFQSQWSQSDDGTAMRVLMQLYNLHRSAGLSKAAAEFYHLSKAAGTSVCTTSATAGCKTYSATTRWTCLMPYFADGPRWLNRKGHDERCKTLFPDRQRCYKELFTTLASYGNKYDKKNIIECQDRAEHLASKGYNFYASEYTLRSRNGEAGGPPELCGQFLNFLVLRSPIPRLRSHLGYLVRLTYHFFRNNTLTYYSNTRLDGWRDFAPAILDNYYTRALLGERGYYAPLGSLTASEHLPAARATLTSMDVVMVMEDLNTTLELGHKWGLGWNVSFHRFEVRTASEVVPQIKQITEQVLPRGRDAEALAAANWLDVQLYQFGAFLSHLDAVVWAVASENVKDPLEGLPDTGDRCGYVPSALRPPRPPPSPPPAR